jgi:hypothetical protein
MPYIPLPRRNFLFPLFRSNSRFCIAFFNLCRTRLLHFSLRVSPLSSAGCFFQAFGGIRFYPFDLIFVCPRAVLSQRVTERVEWNGSCKFSGEGMLVESCGCMLVCVREGGLTETCGCQVFFGYACVGYLLFGHQYESMHTFSHACQFLALSLLAFDPNGMWVQVIGSTSSLTYLSQRVHS